MLSGCFHLIDGETLGCLKFGQNFSQRISDISFFRSFSWQEQFLSVSIFLFSIFLQKNQPVRDVVVRQL
jgi:hypothetical protein